MIIHYLKHFVLYFFIILFLHQLYLFYIEQNIKQIIGGNHININTLSIKSELNDYIKDLTNNS